MAEINVSSGTFDVTTIDKGDWYSALDDDLRRDAVVHIDVSSRLFNKRESFPSVDEPIDEAWAGVSISLPSELLQEEQSVSATITVALPADHELGGLILAKTKRISVSSGSGQAAGVKSALRIVVHPDVDEELWRLCLDDEDGPIIYRNRALPNWPELKEDPRFKFLILPEVIKSIYFDIALNQETPRPWAITWLGFPGAKGLAEDMPGIEGAVAADDVKAALAWAQEVTSAIFVTRSILKSFLKAMEGKSNE